LRIARLKGRFSVVPSVPEASMRDWRYATPRAPHGSRRSGLLRLPIVCAAVLVSSCRQAGVLDPQGPIAAQALLLLINSTAIMLVVVVPVILATLALAWWYRSSNLGPSRRSDES